MPAIKRLAGIAPEVNLRSGAQARKPASNIHPGFETQGRHHQKSKTGVSVTPQKGHVSSKKIFKKKDVLLNIDTIYTHMSCQVEIRMVCEVDRCRLRSGRGVVDDEFVIFGQFVHDSRVHFPRETFFTIRTHARQLHSVTFHCSVPDFLRNQIRRIALKFSCMMNINGQHNMFFIFNLKTGTNRISTYN